MNWNPIPNLCPSNRCEFEEIHGIAIGKFMYGIISALYFVFGIGFLDKYCVVWSRVFGQIGSFESHSCPSNCSLYWGPSYNDINKALSIRKRLVQLQKQIKHEDTINNIWPINQLIINVSNFIIQLIINYALFAFFPQICKTYIQRYFYFFTKINICSYIIF